MIEPIENPVHHDWHVPRGAYGRRPEEESQQPRRWVSGRPHSALAYRPPTPPARAVPTLTPLPLPALALGSMDSNQRPAVRNSMDWGRECVTLFIVRWFLVPILVGGGWSRLDSGWPKARFRARSVDENKPTGQNLFRQYTVLMKGHRWRISQLVLAWIVPLTARIADFREITATTRGRRTDCPLNRPIRTSDWMTRMAPNCSASQVLRSPLSPAAGTSESTSWT